MTYQIRYQKWKKRDRVILYQSLRDKLSLESPQFYMPMFSMYFYLHNTPKALHTIDLERKFSVKEILNITKQRYYNSNMFLFAKIYDSSKNIYEKKRDFL